MNENLNLVEILKGCPKGTKLYCAALGEVALMEVKVHKEYPIVVLDTNSSVTAFTQEGLLYKGLNGECMLFPSKEERDWSKFKPKNPKFNPKTLKPFDKVLARDDRILDLWRCTFFSHIKGKGFWEYATADSAYAYCIPYNDDTKHLVGTNKEAPEFYRYWEE